MVAKTKPKSLPHIYLREWREKRGLKQEGLAEKINSNKAQVSNWENGKRRPSSANQAALADALGVELVDLFRHPDQPSADALLRKASPEIREKVLNIIKVLLGNAA